MDKGSTAAQLARVRARLAELDAEQRQLLQELSALEALQAAETAAQAKRPSFENAPVTNMSTSGEKVERHCQVILIGNLGRDLEVRSFQNGGKIASLRIATSETWRGKNSGERKEKTEWHTITVPNEGLVRVVEQYLRKGSKVYMEGQLETRKWQAQSGQDRYSTEVVLRGFGGTLVMLDGPSGDRGNDQGGSGQQSYDLSTAVQNSAIAAE